MSGLRRQTWLGGVVVAPVLGWLALPGAFSCWPLLGLCLVPLLFSIAALSSARSVFLLGFIAGIVWHGLQLYWIVPVLMHFGGLPWYLAGPALLLLLCYMGAYLGIFAAAFRVFSTNLNRIACCFAAAAFWVGLDWLRSWLFSGFPWMDIGYGLAAVPVAAQAADLFGHYGYTFLVVLSNVSLFHILQAVRNRQTVQAGGVAATVVAVWLVVIGYCWYRWQHVELLVAGAETAAVGIVQGNIDQDRKWSPALRLQTVETYLDMSRELAVRHAPDLIVWPETALPFYPQNSELFMAVRGFVSANRQPLLTGSPWYEIRESPATRLILYYNSALLLVPDGPLDSYYKTHLVPFGEYVPLQRYLPFIAPLVEAVGSFSPGQIKAPLPAGAIRTGVLICFESIFGTLGRAWVEQGANLLINITNDAWYGRSSAPHQSWAMTIFRAIETRRSLVRAANTGISGVIDPLGRVVSESGLFVPWSAVTTVSLLEGRSFFVRGGYLFAPFSGCAALLVLGGVAKRPQRKKDNVV